MAFRCTPEEYELIVNMAAWSGMSRQDYIMAGLTSWVADAAKKIWETKHGQDR